MRAINEIVVHCTATPEGRPVTVSTIRGWHKARGWSDIGYHYVVHLDGRVEAGRPVEIAGSHVAGRNARTIGVVYVGGTDIRGKPKDTRTAAQKQALRSLLLDLIRRFPGIGRVSGHHEFANKACPCFDARNEYRDLAAPKTAAEGRAAKSQPEESYAIKTRSVALFAAPGEPARRTLEQGETISATGHRSGDFIHVSTEEGSGYVREVDLDTSERPEDLRKSRTVKGGIVAMVGALGGEGAAAAAQAIQPLVDYSGVIKGVFVALTVLSVAYMLFARASDAKPGREDAP